MFFNYRTGGEFMPPGVVPKTHVQPHRAHRIRCGFGNRRLGRLFSLRSVVS